MFFLLAIHNECTIFYYLLYISLSDAEVFEDVGEDFWGGDGAFATEDICKVLDAKAEVF